MKNLQIFWIVSICFMASCSNPSKTVPSIGFLDIAEDATLAKARTGFLDALAKNGFSEKDKTLKVYFSNAQGEIAVLNQACDYLISKNVKLIAANSTLSTISAVQHTKDIPVCMMVAPRPDLAGLTDAQGNYPKNLFGVSKLHGASKAEFYVNNKIYKTLEFKYQEKVQRQNES